MITTVGKAKQARCPEDIGRGNGNCQTINCMAWEFWVPPPGTGKLNMEKTAHGQRDTEKLGYCGKVSRR